MTVLTDTEVAGCVKEPSTQTKPWLCLGYRAGYTVREVDAALPHLPADLDGLRILHLSDLHIKSSWKKTYDKVISAVEQWELDMVLCTGDIVDNKHDHRPAWAQVARFLPSLKSHYGTFTVLGNHDNLRMIPELRSIGVNVLDGSHWKVKVGRSVLELIGTPGHEREHLPADFPARFPRVQQGVPRVVMAHYPDFFEPLKTLEPDLYLCGHTHGGQVCLPGGFPLLVHDKSGRKWCRGHHRRGKTHYVVNHGFGFSGVGLRLFCPPELVVITLRKA